MATVQAEPRNGAAEVLQDVQADLSQMGQLYERVSQRLLERLKAVDTHVEALTKERDALRKEVEQLRQTLAESQQDIKLYQRSLLSVKRQPFTFTKEELEEARQGPPLTIEYLLKEIQRPVEG
jgi:peptidoglycan hydrolase CwlO-like protein